MVATDLGHPAHRLLFSHYSFGGDSEQQGKCLVEGPPGHRNICGPLRALAFLFDCTTSEEEERNLLFSTTENTSVQKRIQVKGLRPSLHKS